MTPLTTVPDHHVLTTAEAAAALGHSQRQIENACRTGRIPGAFQTPGRTGPGWWRIPRQTVLQLRRDLGIDP